MTKSRSSMIPPKFSDLPFGEKLLLWALRLWATGAREGTNVQETLRHAFKLAGVPDAYIALDGFLSTISGSATVQFDNRRLKWADISDDEHLLLGLIAAWQQGHGKDHGTALLLSSRFPLAAIYIIQGPASKLAEILKCRGFIIQPRCSRQTEYYNNGQKSVVEQQGRILH